MNAFESTLTLVRGNSNESEIILESQLRSCPSDERFGYKNPTTALFAVCQYFVYQSRQGTHGLVTTMTTFTTYYLEMHSLQFSTVLVRH